MFGRDEMKLPLTRADCELLPSGGGDRRRRNNSGGGVVLRPGAAGPSSPSGQSENKFPSLVPMDDSFHSSTWVPIDFGDNDDRNARAPRSSLSDDSHRSAEDDEMGPRRRTRSWGNTKQRRTTSMQSKPSHDGVSACHSTEQSMGSRGHRHASHQSLSGSSIDSVDGHECDDSYEPKNPVRAVSWGSFLSDRKESRSGRKSPPSFISKTLRFLRYSQQTRRFLAKLYLLGPTIQAILVFGFLILVVRSRRSAANFEIQIRTYRDETSSLLLKLQRIEQNSQSLHKHIGNQLGQAGVELEGAKDDMPVMSEVLHGKAFLLQEEIQEHDYTNIVERYGEGPIKLAFDLGLTALPEGAPKASTTLDIVLWSDTPHAAWTLLDQIERQVWDGAQFHWNPHLAALEISPARDDPLGRGQLQFAEHLSNEKNWHDAWTVGLRQDPGSGRLQLFFNLKDNNAFQDHETCVGRVLGGFDALQTALRSAHAQETNGGDLPSISVHKAVAKHLTRSELAMAAK